MNIPRKALTGSESVRKGFTTLPNLIFDHHLTACEFTILIVLHNHKPSVNCSIARMCDLSGYHDKQVRRTIKSLERKKLIITYRHQGLRNWYELLDWNKQKGVHYTPVTHDRSAKMNPGHPGPYTPVILCPSPRSPMTAEQTILQNKEQERPFSELTFEEKEMELKARRDLVNELRKVKGQKEL